MSHTPQFASKAQDRAAVLVVIILHSVKVVRGRKNCKCSHFFSSRCSRNSA